MNEGFKQLNIHLQTEALPPPFSYQLDIECQPVNENLRVKFNQQYTNRDEVEEEEIIAEGFTGNDDFDWQGELPEVWLKRMQKEAGLIKIKNSGTGVQLKLITEDGRLSGTPQDQNYWEYLVQELTQAIFEQSQKEYPLQMGIMMIDEQQEEKIQWLKFSFAQMKIVDEKGNNVMPWPSGRELLKLIFMLDFLAPEVNKPERQGYYLDPGDGFWYRLGKGATNPHPDNDVQKKIIRSVQNFW